MQAKKNKQTKNIRRGGFQSRTGFLYELTGGDVALDLANTLDDRPAENPRELIPTYPALLSWAQQLGMLNAAEELRLRQRAGKFPKAAEAARKEIVVLRECVFQLFSSIANGGRVPASVLHRFESFVQSAVDRHHLIQDQKNVTWALEEADHDLRSITWTVALAAADLLKSDRVQRIRRCAGSKCDWLFIDTSKRGNRRWCDMTVCGNRAKARSFYSRKKQVKEHGRPAAKIRKPPLV